MRGRDQRGQTIIIVEYDSLSSATLAASGSKVTEGDLCLGGGGIEGDKEGQARTWNFCFSALLATSSSPPAAGAGALVAPMASASPEAAAKALMSSIDEDKGAAATLWFLLWLPLVDATALAAAAEGGGAVGSSAVASSETSPAASLSECEWIGQCEQWKEGHSGCM